MSSYDDRSAVGQADEADEQKSRPRAMTDPVVVGLGRVLIVLLWGLLAGLFFVALFLLGTTPD